MKSGRHIVGKDGVAVAVEFDPDKKETHEAAHGYAEAIVAGTAFNALTPAERNARRVKPGADPKAPAATKPAEAAAAPKGDKI